MSEKELLNYMIHYPIFLNHILIPCYFLWVYSVSFFVHLLSSWKQFRGDIVVVVVSPLQTHSSIFSTPHQNRMENDLKLPVVFPLPLVVSIVLLKKLKNTPESLWYSFLSCCFLFVFVSFSLPFHRVWVDTRNN